MLDKYATQSAFTTFILPQGWNVYFLGRELYLDNSTKVKIEYEWSKGYNSTNSEPAQRDYFEIMKITSILDCCFSEGYKGMEISIPSKTDMTELFGEYGTILLETYMMEHRGEWE